MDDIKRRKPAVLGDSNDSNTVEVYSRVATPIKFTVWDTQGDGIKYANSTPKYDAAGKPLEVVINGCNSSAYDPDLGLAVTKCNAVIWEYIKKYHVTHPFIASTPTQPAQIFSVNSIKSAKDMSEDACRNITEHLTEDVRKQMYEKPNVLSDMR